MTAYSFNDDWTVGPLTSIYAALQGPGTAGASVTLPHDAMIELDRSAESGQGAHSGHFPSAAFEYTKTFDVPNEYRSKRVTLELQGAYRDAVVLVNGDFAAQRPNGYSTFYVELDPFLRYGEANTVQVQVRVHQDSRWYTGAGLHRDAWLHVTELVHAAPGGIRVSTPDVDEERAVVHVATPVRNAGLDTVTVVVHTAILDDADELVATDAAPITLRGGQTVTMRQRLLVADPRRWSPESPHLYVATTTIEPAPALEPRTENSDTVRTSFGIRTLQLDARNGLRINGQPVKLRGACVHHDNGILGAAAIGAAEERRVRILKEAGFNAIRSSHNPASQAMLDACDRLGMLMIDETFDVWTISKSTHDYSLSFPEWWARDVEAMVAKDFNHPSVIMYSIGNENPEAGSGLGSHWGRLMAEKVRELDPTRFVTNGINGFVAAVDEVAKMMQHHAAAAAGSSQGINGAMNMGDFMNQISASPLVTERTAESFAVLDVAGMNYGDARYELDKTLFPNRIILGTETFPSHIHVNWRLVEENAHVIGDFTWTGWDYLGEAGAGRIQYLDGEGATPTFEAEYPWLTSWTGDIDITGHRRPISYFRETVFGLRREPYIAVQRPETFGRAAFAGQWSWSDTVGGWSWDPAAGPRTNVEVYSEAEEVELLLNGRSIGRMPAGRDHGYKAVFEIDVEPGELLAIAYTDGVEQARCALRSAEGPVQIRATAERRIVVADGQDLGFIPIVLSDGAGNLVHAQDRLVSVTVDGPALLAAVGTGRPNTTERFDIGSTTTFDGRALAIVRPTGAGSIRVVVSADDLDPVTVELEAVLDRPAAARVSVPSAPLMSQSSEEE